MGLSLRKLGDAIGNVVSGAGHVAAGVERQLNPFDNGATYSNPTPAPRPAAPQATPIQQAGFNPNFQGPSQMGPPPTPFGLQTSNPLNTVSTNPLNPTPKKKPIVVQSPDNAPAAGDVPALTKAVQNLDAYSQDDQARIVNRAAEAGVVPHNVAAALQNQILSPAVNTDRSNLGVAGEALGRVVLPGYSIYKQIGNVLAQNNLYDQALSGKINPGIVQNIASQANADNGNITNQYGGINAPQLAGAGINEGLKAASLGLGKEAANSIGAVAPTITSVGKTAAKTGLKFGVPGGVAQTLQEDHPTVGSLAKNIALNTAQMAALSGTTGAVSLAGRPVVRFAQDTVDNRVPLNAIGAVGKNVNKPSVNLNKGAFSKADQAYLTKLSDEEKANLPPAQQMELAQIEKYGPNASPDYRGPSLKLKSQQPENKINLVAQTPKAAIGENTFIMSERSRKYNAALNLGDKLSESDKAKLSDALNGKDVGKVNDPARFKQTVSALKDAHDYSLAADRLAGGQTARFNKGNFSPLYFKADTAALDKLGIPKDQQYDLGDGTSMYTQAGDNSPLTSGKYKGYRNIQRKYSSYADAAEQTKGILQPLNANALEDARMYANRGHSTIEGNLLYKQLKKIAPDEVSQDLNQKIAENGEPLVHAANGQLPFAVTKRLNQQLTGFKSSKFDSKIGEAAFKMLEVPSKGLRKVAFLGAPIHYANLTRSFLATTVPSLHLGTAGRGVGEALGASIHPKIYAALQQAADTVKPGQEFSPREFAGKLGIIDRDTRPNLLGKGMGVKGTVEKYSPFALQMRNLNRFNNVLGWKLAERVQELGIKPGTEQATAIGTEINKVIDRINPKMEGLNPIGERIATSGSLAPHWIRANIGLVKDALKQSVPGVGTAKTGFGLSNAGDIARTNVIGGRLLLGGTAILASALATGQMPTLKKALDEAGLNLNNPYPNVQGKSQTKEKYPGGPRYGQVTNLPSDPIGLAVGLLTDPKHFAIARETPALSAATQAITNQDFFGNPVVPDTGQSKAQYAKQMAVATAEKLIPFTGQNVLNKSLTPGQKVEAGLGLRTKTNPNDASYQQAQQHFKDIANTTRGLSSGDAQAVTVYTGGSKDTKTGKYMQPTVWDTIAKATQLDAHPGALQALYDMYQGEIKKGIKVDPLWSQPLANVQSYFQNQANPDPFSNQRTVWNQNNQSWYSPLAKERSQFFNSLPPGDPNKPAQPVEYPAPSPALQQEKDSYYAISNPTQAYQYIKAHPELQNQFDKEFQYKNDLLTARGMTPYKAYPAASPQMESFMTQYNAADKATRKSMRNANPKAYQGMIGYYDSVDLYNIGKQASTSQLQGQPDYSSKEAKDISSLAKDIYQNPDGSYSVVPAGWMNGLSNSSGGSGGYGGKKYVSRTAAELQNPFFNALDIGAGGKPKIGKAQKPKISKTVSFKAGKKTGFQPKAALALAAPTKAKLNLKKSKV